MRTDCCLMEWRQGCLYLRALVVVGTRALTHARHVHRRQLGTLQAARPRSVLVQAAAAQRRTDPKKRVVITGM